MEGYVPPRRQYSFEAILNDLLEFAAETLVPNGRLSFWMPTANEDYEELDIPSNPYMELVSVCVQPFNKCTADTSFSLKLPG
jgi:tRNA (guanine10-N2)-methyltransferase